MGRGSGALRELQDAHENEGTEEVDDTFEIDLDEYIQYTGEYAENEHDSEPETTLQEDLPYTRPTPTSQQHLRRQSGPKPGKTVGSLNIRGRKITTGTEKGSKSNLIMKTMKAASVSILALIDTHWDEDEVDVLRNHHKKHTFHYSNETTNRGGIAFVIDERIEKPESVTFKELIPGRSAIIKVEYQNQTIQMATVYVPNDKLEKIAMIKTLRRKLESEPDHNKIILTGDFNMVEHEMDRSPPHRDDPSITLEMMRLTVSLDLVDGWRNTNENEIEYTWKGKRSDDFSLARIDRIYAPSSLLHLTNEWKIHQTEERMTDHKMVTVKLLEPDPPFIGKGEWRLNPKIFDHPHFVEQTKIHITRLESQLARYQDRARLHRRNPEALKRLREKLSPQKSWDEYKRNIQISAKEAQEKRRRTIAARRRELDDESRRLRNGLRTPLDESSQKSRRRELAQNQSQISQLIEENRRKAEASTAARWFREDEKGSKLWYSMNKERPRRQVFHSLFKTSEGTGPIDEETETRDTDEMLETAKRYHERMQATPTMTQERQTAIAKVEGSLEEKISQEQKNLLTKKICYKEVRDTVRKSKTGKAPGCDGIPNEFWKQEIEWYKLAQKEGNRRTDIINMMKIVFQDIDLHGPRNGNFAEARMSLLYKKKDKRKIENYRPITLLNTDYKVYTTILTTRLKDVAPSIIHPDQAGFMPNRLIYSQTKLVELVIRLCENKKSSGIIMALDQEKAYDRIDHSYLWRIMSKYGIPEAFIIRTQRLYREAKTRIRLNGCVSEAFDVLRGVRQGDPLSCLIYNIAIEPLFELIRSSPLKGIEIHTEAENALVAAYADDTTVFLGAQDDPKTLDDILDLFCHASTAQFNKEKTEIIPIGTKTFREETKRSRTFNGWKYDAKVRIAGDGDAVRILGSWQGNGVDASNKWDEIIEKQLRIMKLWANTYPSAMARARVAKTLVASRALYLMTVNGISEEHLKEMDKNIREFIWQGKKGSVTWDIAVKPKDEGGLGAPSVRVMYEATKIMWLKRWLSPDEERPKWAWAANAILEGSKKAMPHVADSATTEWIEQGWQEKGRSDEIPTSLKQLTKAARRYNAKISVVRAPMELKLNMPAFFHPGSVNTRYNNTKRSKCLRANHAILTINDLITFAEGLDEETHHCNIGAKECKRYARKLLENLNNLWSPYSESPIKDTRFHTPRRISRNETKDVRETPIKVNPDPGDTPTTLGNVRIFGIKRGYKTRRRTEMTPHTPLRVAHPLATPGSKEIEDIYTDGSSELNGWANGRAGLANWHGIENDRNIALRLRGENQSNQRAELAAILLALQRNRSKNLRIHSDSLSSITAILKHLPRWEDLGWHKIKNADILKAILHEIRTKEGILELKWVKAHEDDIGNNAADQLADEGRNRAEEMIIPELNADTSRALHDGARLQSLQMKDAYSIILQMVTQKRGELRHPEKIEEAQYQLEEQTGLRPTKRAIIGGIWKLRTNGRAKDHLWNLTIGRIKCGKYWTHIDGYEERADCAACKEAEGSSVTESEQHLWLECEHNGQKLAWETAKKIWEKTTTSQWPTMSLSLIRGTGALTLRGPDEKPKTDRDSERLRLCITMTLWAIWKVRNQKTIQNLRVAFSEPSRLLIEMLKEQITKEWNGIKYVAKHRAATKERDIRTLWDSLATLERGKAPEFHF